MNREGRCAALPARCHRARPAGQALSEPWAWYSAFGRMSTAEAMRFDMLKNDATAAMSQMSRSVKPASRSAARSLLDDLDEARGQLHGEVEHGAVAGRELGGPPVHRQQFAQRRIARELAHGGAVRREAVEAAVLGRHGHRDHLALQLRQARGRQHQVVVEGGERLQLGVVVRIGVAARWARSRSSRRIWRNRPASPRDSSPAWQVERHDPAGSSCLRRGFSPISGWSFAIFALLQSASSSWCRGELTVR